MLTDEFFLGTKLYHQKFAELCKPIAQYLGITCAMYQHIDKQGKMFNLCTNAPWIERFIEEKYYIIDPLMVHPDNIHNGFAFDAASDNEDFKDTILYDSVINFNFCYSFVYIEKTTAGGYFGFAFATGKDNPQMINKLINSTQIVRNFIRKLHKKLLFITKDLQENPMDFAALKGETFHTQQGLVFNTPSENENKIELFQELGFLDACAQGFFTKNPLSPQEINCLRIYLTTHNIKTVARDLNLAPTTVSSYIENIKIKLSCNTKNELLEKAAILESLGRI